MFKKDDAVLVRGTVIEYDGNDKTVRVRFSPNTFWFPEVDVFSRDATTFFNEVDDLRVKLKAETKEVADLRARLAEAIAERDEAREIVRHANNSLFGSDGYFVLANNMRAVSNAIEDLKQRSNATYREQMAEMRRFVQMVWDWEAPIAQGGLHGSTWKAKYGCGENDLAADRISKIAKAYLDRLPPAEQVPAEQVPAEQERSWRYKEDNGYWAEYRTKDKRIQRRSENLSEWYFDDSLTVERLEQLVRLNPCYRETTLKANPLPENVPLTLHGPASLKGKRVRLWCDGAAFEAEVG
jgi:hypothetical protein